MAIFTANTILVNCELNYDFLGSFADCEFAGNQIRNQISHILGQAASLVQASMFDEGFGIDSCTLRDTVNCRINIANLPSFAY